MLAAGVPLAGLAVLMQLAGANERRAWSGGGGDADDTGGDADVGADAGAGAGAGADDGAGNAADDARRAASRSSVSAGRR